MIEGLAGVFRFGVTPFPKGFPRYFAGNPVPNTGYFKERRQDVVTITALATAVLAVVAVIELVRRKTR